MPELPLIQPQPSMFSFSAQHAIGLIMFIALFTGFQGGRYYAGNIAQELGILCSGLLFLIGAFFSLFHLSREQWNRWVLIPVCLTSGIIVIWGLTFVLRFGGNPLHNMMASREFFFILLAPGIYLCGRSGVSMKTIQCAIWATLVASMLNYLFNYFRLDLQETFFSPDHRISSLVTYDEWRGFRLKPPLFSIMIALLAAIMFLTQRRPLLLKLCALCVFLLACYIWSIVMFRSTLATMILSVFLYPLLLSRPNRIHLWILIVPLTIALLTVTANIIFAMVYNNFSAAEGGNVRLESYQLALQTIPQQLFFGSGEDSAFGVTYATLFGAKFFPSDLGLIGITFKYGIIGLSLYLYFHFSILMRLCQTHWQLIEKNKQSAAIIWAMLIFFSAQTFNLILNPGLAYAQGITTGAMAIALCGLYQHQLQSQEDKPSKF